MSRLERDIAYVRANKKMLTWYERLTLPIIIWLARKIEPYRLARLEREGRIDPYDRQPVPGVYRDGEGEG